MSEEKQKKLTKKKSFFYQVGATFLVVLFLPIIAFRKHEKEQKKRNDEFDRNYEQVGFEKGYIGMRPTSNIIYRKRQTPKA